MPFDLVLFRPGEDRIRRELRAVVGDDHAELATPLEVRGATSVPVQRDAGRSRCRGSPQAFARDVIDVAHAEAPAAGELVVDEIQRPSGIGLRFDEDRRSRADGTASSFPLANRKSFLAIQPVDAVDPRRLSLPLEQENSRR